MPNHKIRVVTLMFRRRVTLLILSILLVGAGLLGRWSPVETLGKTKPILVAECYSGGHVIYMDLVHEYYPSPSGIIITPVAGEPPVFISGDCVVYSQED